MNEVKNIKAMKSYELGKSYFLEYGGCSQCVLLAIKDTIGGISNEVIISAQPLAGGCSSLGKGICGALSGGLLAIGSKFGRDLSDLSQKKNNRSIVLGKSLIMKFEDTFGCFSCQDFQVKKLGQPFDMWDKVAVEKYKTADFRKNCSHITGKVAEWCVDILSQ